MQIYELERRENYRQILTSTLERGWSAQYGKSFRIDTRTASSGQHWLQQYTLSALHTVCVGPEARRFVRSLYLHTPRLPYVPAQWARVFLLSSKIGLRLFSRYCFTVEPPLDDSEHLVVIPGNERVRVFDFRRAVNRVMLKSGFGRRSIETEVELRCNDAAPGPFVPITSYDSAGHWFEEPILDGLLLSRMPPWKSRHAMAERAFRVLDAWLDTTATGVRVEEYTNELLSRILAHPRLTDTDVRIAPLADPTTLDRIAEGSRALGEITLARSHGDFQPGNIFIETPSERVYLIDWEYSQVRQRHYDRLVYGLRGRFPAGLASRMTRYIATGQMEGTNSVWPPKTDRHWRRARIALFLLEELDWHLGRHHSGAHLHSSPGFVQFADEARQMLEGSLGSV